MQFQPTTLFGGSSLQGRVTTTYERLVEVFGLPHRGDLSNDRTRAFWAVEFKDGTRATIYDWKTGLDPWNNVHWNIGGFSSQAAARIEDAIHGQ